MPDVFDPTNIPAEYQQTSQLAEDQLTKLEASDQKVLGPESSTLHLLSSGLTSQTKVLNSLIDKLDSFQLRRKHSIFWSSVHFQRLDKFVCQNGAFIICG